MHVLDKPEVLNTGTDDWDDVPSGLEYAKSPELSSVRVVSTSSNGAHPVKTKHATRPRQKQGLMQ